MKQERAIFSRAKITLLCTGIQWGKTLTGALRMKIAMHESRDPEARFLIVAPTYKILEQSTLPTFLRLMDGSGIYRKASQTFVLHGGGTAYFRTGAEPDSVVGIPNVRHVWGDEAGKFSLYFWQNLRARAAFAEAPITLTTTPYALNWLWKEIVKPLRSGAIEDAELIEARSVENPYFPAEEYDQNRRSMDPRRFRMLFEGSFDKMQGLVYDCWDDEDNLISPFTLPPGTRFFAGVDWGYTHPFVIKVRAITPSGEEIGISEFYQTELTVAEQAEVAEEKRRVFGIEAFYCDPSEPGSIEEFRRRGLPAVQADNDIRRGIDLHYELVKTRRYKEFQGACRHSQNERETYHYPEPEDLKPDQADKEALPVDQDNHCMDADRYLTIMTRNVMTRRAPLVPSDRQEKSTLPVTHGSEIVKRVIRPARHGRQTEEW